MNPSTHQVAGTSRFATSKCVLPLLTKRASPPLVRSPEPEPPVHRLERLPIRAAVTPLERQPARELRGSPGRQFNPQP